MSKAGNVKSNSDRAPRQDFTKTGGDRGTVKYDPSNAEKHPDPFRHGKLGK